MGFEVYQDEGDCGLESVPRRTAGSLRLTSKSTARSDGLFNDSVGIGEERNSSIRSVSGTGSMVNGDYAITMRSACRGSGLGQAVTKQAASSAAGRNKRSEAAVVDEAKVRGKIKDQVKGESNMNVSLSLLELSFLFYFGFSDRVVRAAGADSVVVVVVVEAMWRPGPWIICTDAGTLCFFFSRLAPEYDTDEGRF